MLRARLTSSRLPLAAAAVLFVAACGDEAQRDAAFEAGAGAGPPSASAGSGAGLAGGDDDALLDAGSLGAGGGGPHCEAPDVMIALDRTLTMAKTPVGAMPLDAPAFASSKFAQAIAAIESLTAPPLDQTIRFGLELWPRDTGGCVTLGERVAGTKATSNEVCQEGEIVVPPALGTSGAVLAALDPETTTICYSTPTGAALDTAAQWLAGAKTASKPQYVVLVTDGADWDMSCPDPSPLPIVQALASAGVKTFVVGFSAEGDVQPGAVGAAFLNDMACAGQTAVGFPSACVLGAGGYVAVDPSGAAVYMQADDGAGLSLALHGIAAEVCCDCVK